MNRLIWQGTFILSLAALIVKVLSAIYRIPYQNLAGDVGFYVYQQVYPFYALAIVLGGTGFPIVISKYLSEANERNKKYIGHVFIHAFFVVFLFSIVLFFLLFFGASSLSKWMGDLKLASLLRMVAFIYLFIPFLSIIRGDFQGLMCNMSPTALSQICEQTTRVGIILGLSLFLYHHHGGPYEFGRAAIFGSVMGPFVSLAILMMIYVKYRIKEPLSFHVFYLDKPLIKSLFIEGLTFSILSMTIVAFQFVDVLSLIPILQHFHFQAVKEAKGIFDRSYPLIQLGVTVATTMAVAFIPVLSRLKYDKDHAQMKNRISLVLRVTIVLGSSAAVGLLATGTEVSRLFFDDHLGVQTFVIMGLNIFTMSMIVATSTILQAMQRIWQPLMYLCISLLIKLILNMCFVPILGVTGAAIATVSASLITAILNLCLIQHSLNVWVMRYSQVMKLCFSLFIMTSSVLFWKVIAYHFFISGELTRLESLFMSLTSVGIGLIVFFLVILKTNVFTEEELADVPVLNKYMNKFVKKIRENET
ncbi:oligosaccharide flippase family protein [Terrilactibacillus sp. BCM23-1]|uniref:Oligosaccharide flippase family protein n=1 Tax=Terrilactibacillus tamarindi TaxID=2599694 RepID=A0A6N8CSG5_9BACI|nr:polysaccharide biosynthesis protein [Terrilactibacillus tamarindi]MTT32991.1 oligosaccharide flippase family protein [Terrilactibacillus tamarindi]